MSVDILGTSWNQCVSMVQYCFTSMETIRLVRTDNPGRPPRLSHSSWTMRVFLRRTKLGLFVIDSWAKYKGNPSSHCLPVASCAQLLATEWYFTHDFFWPHCLFLSLAFRVASKYIFPFDLEEFHAWYRFYGNVFLADRVCRSFLCTFWSERARTFFQFVQLAVLCFVVGLCVVGLPLHLCLFALGSLKVQTEWEAGSAVSLLTTQANYIKKRRRKKEKKRREQSHSYTIVLH